MRSLSTNEGGARLSRRRLTTKSTFRDAAASMAAKSALAITIPSQASSGGLGRESGIAFSSTQASSSGYTLEGTKKTGMSVKTKRGTLASVRAAAEAEVNAPKAAAAKPAKGKK